MNETLLRIKEIDKNRQFFPKIQNRYFDLEKKIVLQL